MYAYNYMCVIMIAHQILVDGGWTPWYNQTECSVSCGGGTLTQSRDCTQPSPSCNGSDCEGENVTVTACNTHCCPSMYV